MPQQPAAAGKSSFDLVDRDILFGHLTANNGSRYLDLACGSGRYTLALAEHLKGDNVIYAFDLWEDGIAALRAKGNNQGTTAIKPAVADITQALPLENTSIDVCFIATVLHGFSPEQQGKLIAEVRRVLAAQGMLALIEFKKNSHGPGPRQERRLDEAGLDALVLPHGFKKLTSASLGAYTYLATYAKS